MTEVSDSSTRHGLRETATLVVILAFVMNLLSRGFGETFAVFLLPIESEMGWTRTTWRVFMRSTWGHTASPQW
ncbi:MAG: hypothetical protein CM1200mP18_19020 [Gammaproteobacteria bacterium]|nr:MAG: hypothetical protein CM1200mP18_19020 [Gammaproteobacteria bacterium]